MRVRSTEPEWMDTQTVTAEDFAACLADLATVNTVTRARRPTLDFMRQAARRSPSRPLRVLDVGCGEGDMLRRLHRWSHWAGVELHLTGLDRNPQGIAAARAATPPDMRIAYLCADVFDPGLEDFDVIVSALFTHHLTAAEIGAFLRVMEARARVGWFINDLHRHPVAFHGFRVLSSLAGWHRFVRHDGPISVARSFRREDWQSLLRDSRLDHVAHIRWRLPFRYTVSRFK